MFPQYDHWLRINIQKIRSSENSIYSIREFYGNYKYINWKPYEFQEHLFPDL